MSSLSFSSDREHQYKFQIAMSERKLETEVETLNLETCCIHNPFLSHQSGLGYLSLQNLTVLLVLDIYFVYCTGTRRRGYGEGRSADGTVPPVAGRYQLIRFNTNKTITFTLPNIIFSNILMLATQWRINRESFYRIDPPVGSTECPQ
jgi:hypothetical protein